MELQEASIQPLPQYLNKFDVTVGLISYYGIPHSLCTVHVILVSSFATKAYLSFLIPLSLWWLAIFCRPQLCIVAMIIYSCSSDSDSVPWSFRTFYRHFSSCCGLGNCGRYGSRDVFINNGFATIRDADTIYIQLISPSTILLFFFSFLKKKRERKKKNFFSYDRRCIFSFSNATKGIIDRWVVPQ